MGFASNLHTITLSAFVRGRSGIQTLLLFQPLMLRIPAMSNIYVRGTEGIVK